MAVYKNVNINWHFLETFPTAYFIFGDNLQRKGKGGAAILRDHPHSIGFITKKFPDNNTGSFYTPEEYEPIFNEELKKLKKIIDSNPHKTFYISKIGAGLANKFNIWEKVIKNNLINTFDSYKNVVFCWKKYE